MGPHASRHGAEAAAAGRQIARKHPWLHGVLVPLNHRLTRKRTAYLELRPFEQCGLGPGPARSRT